MRYMLGKADELGHGVEACEVVDADVPSAVMARGKYGTVYFRPGAASGLSQQGSGYCQLVVSGGGESKLLEVAVLVDVLWLLAVGIASVSGGVLVCFVMPLLLVLFLSSCAVVW